MLVSDMKTTMLPSIFSVHETVLSLTSVFETMHYSDSSPRTPSLVLQTGQSAHRGC